MASLAGSHGADKVHVRKLAQQGTIGEGGVDRLPASQECREHRPQETADPIDRADVDAVYGYLIESRRAKLFAQQSRRGEVLAQPGQVSDADPARDLIDGPVAVQVQFRCGGDESDPAGFEYTTHFIDRRLRILKVAQDFDR